MKSISKAGLEVNRHKSNRSKPSVLRSIFGGGQKDLQNVKNGLNYALSKLDQSMLPSSRNMSWLNLHTIFSFISAYGTLSGDLSRLRNPPQGIPSHHITLAASHYGIPLVWALLTFFIAKRQPYRSQGPVTSKLQKPLTDTPASPRYLFSVLPKICCRYVRKSPQ